MKTDPKLAVLETQSWKNYLSIVGGDWCKVRLVNSQRAYDKKLGITQRKKVRKSPYASKWADWNWDLARWQKLRGSRIGIRSSLRLEIWE